jgi:uncharacterized protein YheU (UPF0270 family)
MTNQTNTAGSTYFNLHIAGEGFLNRVREVSVQGKGRRAAPFLAVDISAPRGNKEYARFDCRVSGNGAQDVIRGLMPDIEAEKKVFVRFNLGDLCGESFVYQQGAKAGQTGISLKARLLRVDSATVDGQPVHGEPEDRAERAPNICISGLAYLNRVMDRDDRLFASLSALRGKVDEVEYTHFDTEVLGHAAREIIRSLAPEVEAKRKVLVGFRAQDLTAETFVYRSGKRAGETGVSLRTHLVDIAWAKVDGEMVYKAAERASGAQDQGHETVLEDECLPKAA